MSEEILLSIKTESIDLNVHQKPTFCWATSEVGTESVRIQLDSPNGERISISLSIELVETLYPQLKEALSDAQRDRQDRIEIEEEEEKQRERWKKRDQEIVDALNMAIGISPYTETVSGVERIELKREFNEAQEYHSIELFNVQKLPMAILCIPCRSTHYLWARERGHIGADFDSLYNVHLDHEITYLRKCGVLFAEGKKMGTFCTADATYSAVEKDGTQLFRCGKHSMKLRGSRKRNRKKRSETN